MLDGHLSLRTSDGSFPDRIVSKHATCSPPGARLALKDRKHAYEGS